MRVQLHIIADTHPQVIRVIQLFNLFIAEQEACRMFFVCFLADLGGFDRLDCRYRPVILMAQVLTAAEKQRRQ
ncbi:hypothetical protein D3C76_1305780 [compost metagenome]|uniref:Uncharacterized protein n=1 Tax=Aeromonas media TaxID=651 RepID=A0AAP6GDY4_AERME|nr:hypothetical protein [Aeromonas media]MDX7898939.1 hypothetical protein [Aeromonas media]MDX7923597.1 hypothetical protein [Aeromonas media]